MFSYADVLPTLNLDNKILQLFRRSMEQEGEKYEIIVGVNKECKIYHVKDESG